MTAGELAKATTMWRQAHFGAVMLGSLQISHSSSDQSKMTKGPTSSSQQDYTVEVQKFQLKDVEGSVPHSPFPHFSTINVWANTSAKGHSMWVQSWCLVPSCQQQWYPQQPMGNYTLVPQGCQSACATWVPMLWKYPLKTLIGQIVPANQVPPVVHPTRTATETKYPEQKGWVLEALDLQGLVEWPESEQK